MRSFLILIGTYFVVYFAAPMVTVQLVDWFSLDHSDSMRTGLSILTSLAVYAFLRKRFGQKVPQV